MPESSIDITSPSSGTTQPYALVVCVDYDNQSGTNVWVRVTCSFASGVGGGHYVNSESAVSPGTGTFTANFTHTSEQSEVTISAALRQHPTADGYLYAAASIGNITLNNAPPIIITVPPPPPGPRILVVPDGKERDGLSALRVISPANQPLILEGTYDKSQGREIAVIVVGGKKKRPQIIYETKDGQVELIAGTNKWKATIPKDALHGHKRRGAVVVLYGENRNYVASTSVGLIE